MLIPLQQIIEKYKLNLKGVIHVGAHFAEEHDDYLNCGINKFVYIEPCKDAFANLTAKVSNGSLLSGFLNPIFSPPLFGINVKNVRAFLCACGAEEAEMTMNVSHNNQGQSNSLLAPKLHLQQHPEVVFTDTEKVNVIPLDKLPFIKEDYNFLAMDVQGYELEVLKGATETLKHIDCIMTEINTDSTYDGNAFVWELDAFLDFYEFKRVETSMASPSVTWGDAVYLKSHLL
jgi:FkbM family methyltransferase